MELVLLRHIIAIIISTACALYVLPVVRKIAFRWNILDYPDGRVKVHSEPIPYLGGFVLYIPFIASLAITFPLQNSILWLLIGCTFLLLVGLLDDLMVFTPLQKILGQIFAVLCFLKGGFSLKAIFFSTFINVAASGFWMLLVINAFNLVDVMDGLSATLAIVATGSFLVISLVLEQYVLSLLLLAFICPLLVFFYYNKPPARIYLGDAGALFVGGFLSAMPLFFSWSGCCYYGYLVPLLILVIPLLEVSALIIIRTYKGIPFYRGSPHHFSHYLRAKGWTTRQTLIFTGSIASLVSTSAVLFLFSAIPLQVFLALVLVVLFFWVYRVFFERPVKNRAA